MACDRFYTHSIVSYATLDELQPLLAECSQYVYVCHNRDVTDTHYHIIATFKVQKSFKAVRNLVVSPSNTFSQALEDLDAYLTYLTHEHEDGKAEYSTYEFVYSNREYWAKRLKNDELQSSSNDMFVDDLISKDYSYEFMARKYGRDFIKNYRTYTEFRSVLLIERGDYS